MAVLGIISCEIIEDELAWLLAEGKQIEWITILENQHSRRFLEQLTTRAVSQTTCIPHISSFSADPSHQHEALVKIMDIGLHRSKEVLQQSLREAARELRHHINALFLGYGVCGNALMRPAELLDLDIPIFTPTDQGLPVDDCVAMMLGGRAPYLAEQKKEPGTYYMTPGWSRHWKSTFPAGENGGMAPETKRLFSGYKRMLLIPTSIMNKHELSRNTNDFKKEFNPRVEVAPGTLHLLNESWQSALSCLSAGCHGKPGKEA